MKKKSLSLLCTVILSVMFFACKEDLGDVGLNLQPEDELLNTDFFDTTTLTAYSTRNDSLITSNLSMNLLGDMQDPVFGRTQAAIYAQVRLSKEKVDFGKNKNSYADSLVLNMVYGGHYGDTMQTLRIRVYELNEDLQSTVYYSSSTLARKSELLGEIQLQPTPNTPSDTSKTAYISIPLNKNFAKDKLLDASLVNLSTNAEFVKHFKGLYIEAEAVLTNGCMLSINLPSKYSKMTLYYGNDDKPNQSFDFTMAENDSSYRFSHINHFDYANVSTELSAQLNGNDASSKEVLFGQSAGGVKTVIQFPNLKAMFADKQVVIHKAELVISQKEDASPLQGFTPPANLSLSYDRSLTDRNLTVSDAKINATYFGGAYDAKKNEYAFRITRYIQQMLSDVAGNDYKLNLMVVPAATRLSRSMFYGTDPQTNAEKRIKLKINYTIINK